MTEQNFNPQATLKSCFALSDALDRFLNYLEESFDLSADEATWMLAGIIHSQPCLTESNLETKKQLASMAQHIKLCSAVQHPMNKIKRLLTNIHFWIWAATHSDRFCHFEITAYPTIKASWYAGGGHYEYLVVRISFCKPKFFYSVSTYAAAKYAESHGISTDVLYTLEDIPF